MRVMRVFLSLLLLLTLYLHRGRPNPHKSLLVKSYDEAKQTMSFYLVYHDDRSVHLIPDNTTLQALAHELSQSIEQVPLVAQAVIPGIMTVRGVLPSLLLSNNSRIAVSELVERSLFFRDETLTPLKLWNPSVVVWLGRYLLCWRDGGKVAFGWLNERGDDIDEKSFLGLGGKDGTLHPIRSGEIEQEDPRMLVLSDDRLVVAFTGFFPDPKRPHKRIGRNIQCFVIARYATSEKRIVFDEHIHKFDQNFGSNRQKNWVVFERDSSVHFIQHIQQMKILKYTNVTDPVSHTAAYEEVAADSGLSKGSLPWKSRLFGGHLRGGTPAILVHPKYYLMLFHTSFTHRMSEYFMGALTFCSSPPFQVQSMSSHPILRTERFYIGDFINGYLHYVIYPSGLIRHPQDNDTLIVSFGHQDKHGYLVHLNLTSLLQSLTMLNHC